MTTTIIDPFASIGDISSPAIVDPFLAENLPTKSQGSLSKRAGNIYREMTAPVKQNVLVEGPQKLLRVAGEVGGAATDIGAGLIKGAYGMLPDFVQEGISGAGEYLLNTDMGRAQAETLKGISGLYGAATERFPESMKNIEAGLNIAGGMGVAKGAKRLVSGIKAPSAGKLLDKARGRPSSEQAVGQVLQGKVKDLPRGKEALANINIEGVKTYPELKTRIDNSVKSFANLVDEELMLDSTPRTLDNLAIATKSKGGAVVKTNYVNDGLKQLKELYTKINDPVRAQEIDELASIAEKQGLTKKQVNGISRMYGNEFGDKAFNKTTGDPLTSINGQAYENTREGLKETARVGMGEEAKRLDMILSSILRTRTLIERNIEAVNKLKQKVDPRRPLEKLSHAVVKAADVVTNGLLRGTIAGFLPRGVGYKVFNALDLEEKLERNLKIINKGLVQNKEAPILLPPRTGRTYAFGNEEKKAVEKFGIPEVTNLPQGPTAKSFQKESVASLRGMKTPQAGHEQGISFGIPEVKGATGMQVGLSPAIMEKYNRLKTLPAGRLKPADWDVIRTVEQYITGGFQ